MVVDSEQRDVRISKILEIVFRAFSLVCGVSSAIATQLKTVTAFPAHDM